MQKRRGGEGGGGGGGMKEQQQLTITIHVRCVIATSRMFYLAADMFCTSVVGFLVVAYKRSASLEIKVVY